MCVCVCVFINSCTDLLSASVLCNFVVMTELLFVLE